MKIPEQETGDERAYVLMTAAYNEEAHIEQTIAGVLSQTLLPKRWLIVSDGSTDRTDQIVESTSKRFDFIRYLRVTRPPGHSFSSKVIALQRGAKLLEGSDYRFIGNLDADIFLLPTYFESVIRDLEHDSKLGITSGFVYEETTGQFRSRNSNRVDAVPHAAQLVRRECYEAIGGYAALKYGGEDWYAQTRARMLGWYVRANPELKVFHQRRTGAGANVLCDRFRLGKLDYSFGSYPIFELFKCLLRLRETPYLVGAASRLAGFAWSYIRRESRPVSDEFVTFLRTEQKERFRYSFSSARMLGGRTPMSGEVVDINSSSPFSCNLH
jgi:glycosyltransferase involved in cell wall biosynthesis